MSLKQLPEIRADHRLAKAGFDLRPDAVDRWEPTVCAAVDDPDKSISIYDAIGENWEGTGVTAKRISAALRNIGPKDITVNINSPGGDFFEGMAIYNLLREHKAKVTVHVLGVAASAASVIAMAGDEILMGDGSFLMIHNAWAVAVGNRHDMTDTAAVLAPFDAAMASLYAAQAGIDEREAAKLMDQETWLGAQRAVDDGFATGLLRSSDITRSAQASASRKPMALIEAAMAKSGYSRSARRDAFKALFSNDKPGAVDPPAKPSAGHEVAASLHSPIEHSSLLTILQFTLTPPSKAALSFLRGKTMKQAHISRSAVRRGLVAAYAEAAPSGAEVKALIDGIQTAFAQFKAEHTKQIEEIKAGRSGSDQEAVLAKINADLERLQRESEDAHTKIAAAQSGPGVAALRDKEYTASFNAHMRKGDVQSALNKGAAEEGGFLTPVEWDRTITDMLREESPMRELAQVQPTSKAGWTKLFNMGGTGSGWVGETDQRPETATPNLKALGFGHGEIYANPAATQQILDDAEINLDAWLASEVQAEFAEQEGAAFISGDGVKKPAGILTYVEGGTNAAKHPFGAIKAVNSGAAADIGSDAVLDLIYGLPKKFRQNARFLTNNLTIAKLRKLKDGQGNYLWQPSAQAGQPATLHGYGIAEDENMPDVVANSLPVLFGDYKRGYLIIDRMGIRVLRDPYTKKPYVLFYTTKRVGGGVQNPECLRALKVAA